MSVNGSKKIGQLEIRHSLALMPSVNSQKAKPKPKKQPTARMKIINGRGYFYEVRYEYDKETKATKQKQRYLGKSLPKGYRLIK